MMNFKEFTNMIIEELEKRMDNISVSLQKVDKINGVKLHGLIFKSEVNISPTIYIDEYFRQYSEFGKSIDLIIEEVVGLYLKNRVTESIDITFFTDIEKVKSRIIFTLVNYNENKELLKKVPHVKYLDLAIIFKCLVSNEEDASATILIHYNHLSFWNIEINELYELAMQNTPNLLEYRLENMTQVLCDIFDEEFPNEIDMRFPMYVLSNRTKINGASCILYNDLLSTIAERYQTDFYILPSSIHEVILLPVTESRDMEELSEMTKEVNATQLSKEEILSDHAYYYSRETGEITF